MGKKKKNIGAIGRSFEIEPLAILASVVVAVWEFTAVIKGAWAFRFGETVRSHRVQALEGNKTFVYELNRRENNE